VFGVALHVLTLMPAQLTLRKPKSGVIASGKNRFFYHLKVALSKVQGVVECFGASNARREDNQGQEEFWCAAEIL
jgi:hypothetical protein